MKFSDLDGTFLKYVDNTHYQMIDSLAEADGVQFQCPKCSVGLETGRRENGKGFVRGAHYVICWFVGKVPDDLNPKPGRWTPSGTGLNDLTFIPGEPPRAVSVLLTGPGCGWHGHVVNGDASLS